MLSSWASVTEWRPVATWWVLNAVRDGPELTPGQIPAFNANQGVRASCWWLREAGGRVLIQHEARGAWHRPPGHWEGF